MFYNYLIFNMVTLSLRILLKYCVSLLETLRVAPGNNSGNGCFLHIWLVYMHKKTGYCMYMRYFIRDFCS